MEPKYRRILLKLSGERLQEKINSGSITALLQIYAKALRNVWTQVLKSVLL